MSASSSIDAPVVLRGVNLGGWLLQESWMCPVVGLDNKWAYWDTLYHLERRFGPEQAAALVHIYEDNWLTTADLDRIQAMGLNAVRVPFWYRNFQSDDHGTWKLNEDGEIDFSRLDWVVEECGKRGIYVVLDMHGAPGFQSDNHCTGRIDACEIYDDTDAGYAYRLRAIELWEAIARHFKGNSTVAAYDLLNEPMNGNRCKDRPENKRWLWDLYDRMYRAIRAIDPDHIITVEGVWEWDNLPDPALFGWTNVVYQLHNYNYKKCEIDFKIRDTHAHDSWNVPLFVGEFQGGPIWEYALDAYNGNGISWTTWTFKGGKCDHPSSWFLYSGKPDPVDPVYDSYEDIARKWGTLRTEESFLPNEEVIALLTRYAGVNTSGPLPFLCARGRQLYRR